MEPTAQLSAHRRRRLVHVLAAGAAGLWLTGCATHHVSLRDVPRHLRDRPEVRRMVVTAYCPCGSCCGWRRNWLLRPVYASGPLRGRRKEVGVTASGTRARPGTVAADTRSLPFGTILEVPGYGFGRVEDRGGDITGDRLDLFFRTHHEALVWGRRTLNVRVWLPEP